MDRALRGICLIAAALFLGYTLWTLYDNLVYNIDQHSLGLLSMLALLICMLSDSILRQGGRTTLVLALLVGVLSFTAEYLGVRYGFPFGAKYHYTDQLGPKLGGVPLVIPSLWFAVLYLSFGVADLLAGFTISAETVRRSGWGATLLWAAWISLIGGLGGAAWDLAVDPVMVQNQVWVWEPPGPFYAIPIGNFAGWALVGWVISLIYRLWQGTQPPIAPPFGLFGRLPVWMYGVMAAMAAIEALLHDLPVVAMVGAFATGALLLSAVLRLVAHQAATNGAAGAR